jgi:hypothetical protein
MEEINGMMFLVAGDELERGGVVEPGHVGLRLNCGTEITDTVAGMALFTMALVERFILDPRVVITGNPVDGFEYYGPVPLSDPGECLDARTRLIEERGDGDWWLAPLRPLSALEPVDGDSSDLAAFAEGKAAAVTGWYEDGTGGFDRQYGGGEVGKVRPFDGHWSGWVERTGRDDTVCIARTSADEAMAAVDVAYALG